MALNRQCRPSGTNELILADVLRRIVGNSAMCIPSPEPPGGTSSHPNYPVKTNDYRTQTFRMRRVLFCIRYYTAADTRCTVAKLTELQTSRRACHRVGKAAIPCRHLFAEFRCHRQTALTNADVGIRRSQRPRNTAQNEEAKAYPVC